HRGPERVRERKNECLPAEREPRRLRGDRAQHGTRAGDEDESEADAEQEPAAEVARPASRQEEERPLDPLADLGYEERRRQQEEEADRDVAEEVVRQPERVEAPGREEGEDGEARDEARDDRVRAATAAARSAREEDRQHGKDARRDRRDHAGGERDGK